MKNLLICLTVVFTLSAKLASATDLEEIRLLWLDKAYPQVLSELLKLRDSDFGKTVEVDYMLATSLCRHGNDFDLGQKFLINILRVYELSTENRKAIAGELDHCPDQNQPEQLAFLVSRSTGGGDAGVRGKMFYYLGGKNRAIGGDPLESVVEIPAAEIAARLFESSQRSSAIREMDKRLSGLGFQPVVIASNRFVIGSISDHDQDQLTQIARQLEASLDYFISSYNIREPRHFLSVYLVPDGTKIRLIGNKLHGLNVSQGAIGYSFRNDLSVTAVVRGPLTGTLKHELTHILVRSNFGDIPPWLDEGLAALYEVSRLEGAKLRGLPNWRGEVLKRLWHNEPGIAEVLGMNWKEFDAHEGSMEQQAVNHALARYWILFLQDRGYLDAVYNTIRIRDIRQTTEDPIADTARLIRIATNIKLAALESEFNAWLPRVIQPINKSDIEKLQSWLNQLGYDAGNVDGLTGPKTRKAVKQFQRDNSLEADGIIDQSLFAVIKSLSGQ